MRRTPQVWAGRLAAWQQKAAPGLTGRVASAAPVRRQPGLVRLTVPQTVTTVATSLTVSVEASEWLADLATYADVVNEPVPAGSSAYVGNIGAGSYGVIAPRSVSPGPTYTPWWAVVVDVDVDGTPTVGTAATFDGMANATMNPQFTSVLGDGEGNLYFTCPAVQTSPSAQGLMVQHFDFTGTPTDGWGVFVEEAGLFRFSSESAQFTNANTLSLSAIDGDDLVVASAWRSTNDSAGYKKVKVRVYVIDRTTGTLLDSADVVGPTHTGTPSYADNIPRNLFRTAAGEFLLEVVGSSNPSSITYQTRLFPISVSGGTITVGTAIDVEDETGHPPVGLSGDAVGMQASGVIPVLTHETSLVDGTTGSGASTYIDTNGYEYRAGGGLFRQTTPGMINPRGLRELSVAPRGNAGVEIVAATSPTHVTSSVSAITPPGTWNEGDGDDIEVDRDVSVAAESDRGLAVASVYYEEDGTTAHYGLWLVPFTLT